MGQEAAEYLRVKRKRLSAASYRSYESDLDKLARYFPDLRIEDFEPPVGTARLEQFLDDQWGMREPRTYNRALTVMRDFFKSEVMRGRLHGDPTLPIERARTQQVYRSTFDPEQIQEIIRSADNLRDRLALRLLLHYGLRQGALRAVQYKHFNGARRRVTIFSKGGTVRELPIPQETFWIDLRLHMLETGAQAHHYLLPTAVGNQWSRREQPTKPMSNRMAHMWWYGCLADAGIVPKGTTKGEKMHKARHTAGQRVLDKTHGNLKAVQKLLGHSSIQTTADVYVDWDDEQLAASLEATWGDEDA